jgi:hypothetical protein
MRRKGYGDHADTGDGGTDTAASGAWVFPDAGIRISQGASGAWRAGSKVIPSSPTHPSRSSRTIGVAEQSAQVAPLLQWLHETAGPRVGLNEVRRRLANLPGSMSDAIYEEREDRF